MEKQVWKQFVRGVMLFMAMTIVILSMIPGLQINAQTVETVYECEAEGNEFVGGGPYGNESASGGYAVGNMGSNGANYFIMKNITVPADGDYQVDVIYAAGDARTFRIGINGAEGELYTPEVTGSFEEYVGKITVNLTLKAGENELKFYSLPTEEENGDTEWMPNFDKIIVKGDIPGIGSEDGDEDIVEQEDSGEPDKEDVPVTADTVTFITVMHCVSGLLVGCGLHKTRKYCS